MSYPEYANINGERYKINTDFRVGVRCFDVINDNSICDEERALAVVYLLFGFLPENDLFGVFLDKATLFLQCGKDEVKEDVPSPRKPDMDFTLDMKYISASFMSDYRIDLHKADLHFWQFCELIQGLTESCVLSRVRDLRNQNLEEIKDNRQRIRVAQAQRAVALPVRHTQEELEAIEDFERRLRGE